MLFSSHHLATLSTVFSVSTFPSPTLQVPTKFSSASNFLLGGFGENCVSFEKRSRTAQTHPHIRSARLKTWRLNQRGTTTAAQWTSRA